MAKPKADKLSHNHTLENKHRNTKQMCSYDMLKLIVEVLGNKNTTNTTTETVVWQNMKHLLVLHFMTNFKPWLQSATAKSHHQIIIDLNFFSKLMKNRGKVILSQTKSDLFDLKLRERNYVISVNLWLLNWIGCVSSLGLSLFKTSFSKGPCDVHRFPRLSVM